MNKNMFKQQRGSEILERTAVIVLIFGENGDRQRGCVCNCV